MGFLQKLSNWSHKFVFCARMSGRKSTRASGTFRATITWFETRNKSHWEQCGSIWLCLYTPDRSSSAINHRKVHKMTFKMFSCDCQTHFIVFWSQQTPPVCIKDQSELLKSDGSWKHLCFQPVWSFESYFTCVTLLEVEQSAGRIYDAGTRTCVCVKFVSLTV